MNLEIKKSIKPINYLDAINLLEARLSDLRDYKASEIIWTLEHNKVFTAGSSTPKEFNKNKINNIEVLKVNRGGKITYHGPGQMIIYPIINIKFRKLNLIEYINQIEEICIDVFQDNQIELFRKKEKNRGLWVKSEIGLKKIIFIGLRYSKGVIHHGLSINFNNDLENFRKIDPCGLHRREISSLKELKVSYNKNKIIKELKESFTQKFDLNSI